MSRYTTSGIRLAVIFAVCATLQPCSGGELEGREPSASSVDAAGAIQGTVSYAGHVPESKIRNNAGERRKLLEVRRGTGGVRYVLAYVDAFRRDIESKLTDRSEA